MYSKATNHFKHTKWRISCVEEVFHGTLQYKGFISIHFKSPCLTQGLTQDTDLPTILSLKDNLYHATVLDIQTLTRQESREREHTVKSTPL